jgi:hypothetical protein
MPTAHRQMDPVGRTAGKKPDAAAPGNARIVPRLFGSALAGGLPAWAHAIGGDSEARLRRLLLGTGNISSWKRPREFRIGSALLAGIGPILLIASRVMLLRNGHQHTAWILLQDTEKLNLVKYIPSVTVVRSEYDLQVFCGHRIKFEWLIRCLEDYQILGLKFSYQFEGPGE